MRRVLIGLVAVALVGAAVLYAYRAPLATALMTRVATANLARDFVAELEDGLHVFLCGAGSPLPDPERSGPCVAIVAGTALVVVDAGAGAQRNMARLGLPVARIQTLLLTHFHSDHIDGVGELALQRWVGGTHTTPLPIMGPPGVEAVVAGFNAAYRLDSGYRTLHHGPAVAPPAGAGGDARPFALPDDGAAPIVWRSGGLEVRAFRVDHHPVAPAVGYRFDYGGRSVVVSGDTVKSANLQKFAEGADVLVHEALAPHLVALLDGAATRAGRASAAKILQDIPGYHTSPVQAAEIARDAHVGHLLFHHIVPPLVAPGAEAAFVEGVADVYEGPFTVGRDGTRISLPTGSDTIELDAPR
jgi:ribonuclease Z